MNIVNLTLNLTPTLKRYYRLHLIDLYFNLTICTIIPFICTYIFIYWPYIIGGVTILNQMINHLNNIFLNKYIEI